MIENWIKQTDEDYVLISNPKISIRRFHVWDIGHWWLNLSTIGGYPIPFDSKEDAIKAYDILITKKEV